SRIGMAVKAGAKKPDISTESGFRQLLLDAKSIACSDSASGLYITTELFRKLGIAEQLAPKTRVIAGSPVGDAVARGDAEIGFHQISELLPVRGITVVGPIPDSVQSVTTFSAGIVAKAQSPDGARQLVAHLASSRAAETIRQTGLEPIVADEPGITVTLTGQ